jgi:ribosomal-protein-alanine N-acetyltransferase
MSDHPGSLTAAAFDAVAFVPMDQADADAVAAWRYPGIYAFYDFAADCEDLAELLDPAARSGTYFSVRSPAHGLIGFVELKPAGPGAVEIGLGLAPEHTGRKLGHAFVQAICAWVSRRGDVRRLVLRVATFNTRAMTVYQRAGFTAVGTEVLTINGGEFAFVVMERLTELSGAVGG